MHITKGRKANETLLGTLLALHQFSYGFLPLFRRNRRKILAERIQTDVI